MVIVSQSARGLNKIENCRVILQISIQLNRIRRLMYTIVALLAQCRIRAHGIYQHDMSCIVSPPHLRKGDVRIRAGTTGRAS